MKIATTLLAASALLLSLSLRAEAPACSGECKVQITMSAGCGSGIKVSPDPLFIAKGAEVKIVWTITSPGWAFASNGIAVHLDEADFGGKISASGTNHVRPHKNKGPKVFKYDVNLVDDKKVPCKLDPTIVDQ
jgi:hypothetical protein